MSRHTRPVGCAVALAAALIVSACAPLHVDSYLDRRADFSRYRSYTWEWPEAFSTGDARLDNNRFFIDRAQTAVDETLLRRGFERTEAAGADVTLHVHAHVAQRLDTTALDRQYGRCDVPDCWPVVYDAGTLVIDVTDTRTGKLAWRGWAETSFDGVVDDQKSMDVTIDKAVAKILSKLPPVAR